jgi:hypothetical protein
VLAYLARFGIVYCVWFNPARRNLSMRQGQGAGGARSTLDEAEAMQWEGLLVGKSRTVVCDWFRTHRGMTYRGGGKTLYRKSNRSSQPYILCHGSLETTSNRISMLIPTCLGSITKRAIGPSP